MDGWQGPDGELGLLADEMVRSRLRAYAAHPRDVHEHANIERNNYEGGYGQRQSYELIQNGADALHEAGAVGRIELRVTDDALYCANEGVPLDEEGMDALLASHMSHKRGGHIGRFGLGFKSVLGVSTSPEVYSRTVSLRFAARAARERIVDTIGHEVNRYPVLRVPTVIDPTVAAEDDPLLATYMTWASTIVKVPLDRDPGAWLDENVKTFPPEFLLFTPHVHPLVLRSDRTGDAQTLGAIRAADGAVELTVGDDRTRWWVFEVSHNPSQQAKDDAGEWAQRDSVPVTWAVPESSRARRGRGRFWAFFPTQIIMALSGIINAPWHMNNDRQNLLDGPFNRELVDVVGKLVADNIARLFEPDDPAAHLDALPGTDARIADQWNDLVAERVFAHATDAAIVPNQDGTLMRGSSLRMAPLLPEEVLGAWASTPTRPRQWVHHRAITQRRQPRVIQLSGTEPSSVVTWIRSLGDFDRSVEQSASQVAVMNALLAHPSISYGDRLAVTELPVVRTSTGRVVPLGDESVMLPAPDLGHADIEVVDPELASRPDTHAILLEHGHRVYDGDPLHAMLLKLRGGHDVSWPTFWSYVSDMGAESVLERVRDHKVSRRQVKVRRVDGAWVHVDEVLRQGPVVGPEDAQVCLDSSFHRSHEAILEWLDVVAAPLGGRASVQDQPWWRTYLRQCRTDYFARYRGRSKPQDGYLIFRTPAVAGPLVPFDRFQGEAQARYTAALLEAEDVLTPWFMFHKSRDVYPQLPFEHPLLWVARQGGSVATSQGAEHAAAAWGPGLAGYEGILPVCADTVVSSALGLPMRIDEGGPERHAAALRLAEDTDDLANVGALYAELATAVPSKPLLMRCRASGSATVAVPEDVLLVTSASWTPAMDQVGEPFLIVSSADAEVLERWGCTRSTNVREELVVSEAREAVALTDLFPSLLGRGAADRIRVIRCASLRLSVVADGYDSPEHPHLHRDGEVIYATDDVTDAALLDLCADAAAVSFSRQEREQILTSRATAAQLSRRAAVRETPSLAQRAVRAIGRDQLRASLPQVLVSQVDPDDDETLGEIALAVHGVDLLRTFRGTLEANGLGPPQQWTGAHATREFVHDLGFPEEHAGFRTTRPPDREVVLGPATLQPLHAFQQPIHDATLQLLASHPPDRGLISLPTGAGKTRIAVQSIVEHLRSADDPQVVLWVAQTEELCEQAVQTIRYVWRAYGPDEALTISRLWGSNQATAAVGHHVVVAGISKLSAVTTGKHDYAWLRGVTALFIDEAHRSVPKSYTELLRWLGLRVGPRRGTPDRAPVVGLTATPFRGTNESETSQLVARYDGRRLDHAAFAMDEQVHDQLQREGFLADIDHQVLSGAALELSAADAAYLDRYAQLPPQVEETLGADEGRNHEIVQAILALPDDWPVLAFAASVEHAQVLAAMLRLRGIPSAPIWGDTPRAARRHYIQQFRAGQLRVLTNYNVLAEGFDAPAVRAVIIGRPTFSPNRYQQMIGRGLRGPRNGGEDTCLIIDVEDNLERFGHRLAFRDFEYLWGGEVIASPPPSPRPDRGVDPQASAVPDLASPLARKDVGDDENAPAVNPAWGIILTNFRRAREDSLATPIKPSSALGGDIDDPEHGAFVPESRGQLGQLVTPDPVFTDPSGKVVRLERQPHALDHMEPRATGDWVQFGIPMNQWPAYAERMRATTPIEVRARTALERSHQKGGSGGQVMLETSDPDILVAVSRLLDRVRHTFWEEGDRSAAREVAVRVGAAAVRAAEFRRDRDRRGQAADTMSTRLPQSPAPDSDLASGASVESTPEAMPRSLASPRTARRRESTVGDTAPVAEDSETSRDSEESDGTRRSFWEATLPIISRACASQRLWQRTKPTGAPTVSMSVTPAPRLQRVAYQLGVTSGGSFLRLILDDPDSSRVDWLWTLLARNREGIDDVFGPDLRWEQDHGRKSRELRWDNSMAGGFGTNPREWPVIASSLGSAMWRFAEAVQPVLLSALDDDL